MPRRRSAGVSMEPEFEERAKRRARSLGLSFSAYINQLVRKDLGMPSASLEDVSLLREEASAYKGK